MKADDMTLPELIKSMKSQPVSYRQAVAFEKMAAHLTALAKHIEVLEQKVAVLEDKPGIPRVMT